MVPAHNGHHRAQRTCPRRSRPPLQLQPISSAPLPQPVPGRRAQRTRGGGGGSSVDWDGRAEATERGHIVCTMRRLKKLEEVLGPAAKRRRLELGEERALGWLLSASPKELWQQKAESEPASRGLCCEGEQPWGKQLKPWVKAASHRCSPKEELTSKQGSDQAPAVRGDGVSVPQKVPFPVGRLSMRWERLCGVGAGLHNLGLNCFLNATLQCLTHTAPLASYLLSEEHGRSCHQEGFCMLCTMQNHVVQAFASSGQAIKPVCFIRNLKNISQHLRFGRQEDAHEFLRYTIDAMQQACLNSCAQLDGQSQAPTLVHQIFGGSLRSRVMCLECKSTSDTYEPYLDLALEIGEATSVVQALKQFVKPELLCGENAYECARCQQKVSASKRFSIHRAANVLTVALKRFAHGGGGKITKDVRYPMLLNVRPYMSARCGDPLLYSLYAVLVHSGHGCHTGHYYCYVQASNGQWYRMNDEEVCSADTRKVLKQQAYLLFYQRIPSPRKSSEGPIAEAASSMPGCAGSIPDERPDLLSGKQLPGLEEVGVPVAHSAFGTGSELLSGATLPKLPAGSPPPRAEGSGDTCQDYLAQLQCLTRSSKSYITKLTILAQQNVAFASSIVSLVEAQVAEAPPSQKLPAMYLMDSIVKNVGGAYLKAFASNLVEMFLSVFEKVDTDTRKSLFLLRSTWDGIFPLEKLHALDVRVKSLDPAWPVKPLPPDGNASGTPVSPQPAAPWPEESTAPTSATAGASAPPALAEIPQPLRQEQLLRQQVLEKEKQLLELRQKLSELEQAQAQFLAVLVAASHQLVLLLPGKQSFVRSGAMRVHLGCLDRERGDMVFSTLKLGISILNGDNAEVQQKMLEYLKEKQEAGFVQSIQALMKTC
ncbi:ubiquitin carboxyl-terminal hydrolase 36-like, partial [Indicator indicator]|uniref:ubiquitin carboxyl-terminal hydrolase 36-like n=1 Tax=Indicator indicator TaxID=1002788 RepID=UPI0023DED77F